MDFVFLFFIFGCLGKSVLLSFPLVIVSWSGFQNYVNVLFQTVGLDSFVMLFITVILVPIIIQSSTITQVCK